MRGFILCHYISIPLGKEELRQDKITSNNTQFGALNKFGVAKYIFLLNAKEEINLPLYKGWTLRGGFGVTFRKICCIKKDIIDCKDCIFKNKCAYAYIFVTSPLPDSKRLRNLEEIRRPFVIKPPAETKRYIKKVKH